MAAVKNRLKIFESADDPDNMASTRPQTALKPPIFGQNVSPALQKLLNKQLDASNNEGGESVPQGADSSVKKGPDTVAKGLRNGVGFGVNADKSPSNPPAASKPVGARPPVGAAKPSEFRRGSQVSVPSVFKQEAANTTSPPDSRRSSQVNVPEAFKVNSKPAVPETNSSDDNKKPKPFAKPGATFPRPPPNPKPPLSSAETTVPSNSAQSSLNKKVSEAHKTENNVAHPSNKENSVAHPSNKESAKFKLPGVDELQLKSSYPTAASTSSLSSQPPLPSEDKVTDFKSMLRSTKPQTPAEKKAAIKPVLPSGTSLLNRVAAVEAKQTSGQGKVISNGFTKGSTLPSSFQGGPDVAGLSSRLQGNLWKPPGQNIKKQQDPAPEPVLERKSDSKKFKKVKLEASFPICASPEKPALPGNIDLAVVKQQYQKALQLAKDTSSSGELDENTDEIYNDGKSMDEVVVSRTTNNKRQSERISIIPDMSAEEEGAIYDDGLTLPLPSSPPLPNSPPPAGPDEVYVDAESERQMEEMEQLYEDEQTFALSAEKIEEEKKRIQREEAEAKKKEEKEKKEKEKEEDKKRKKEQKDKVKKEKEEMQMRKKFGLSGTETGVGEGTIKQDIKAWIPGGLSLKKGQVITIIRLDNNPANKWLIKSDNTMGYVDSSIIEVDPSIIRQVMASQATGGSLSSEVDDDQPVYDDVPHDGHPNDLIDDGEIYEECP